MRAASRQAAAASLWTWFQFSTEQKERKDLKQHQAEAVGTRAASRASGRKRALEGLREPFPSSSGALSHGSPWPPTPNQPFKPVASPVTVSSPGSSRKAAVGFSRVCKPAAFAPQPRGRDTRCLLFVSHARWPRVSAETEAGWSQTQRQCVNTHVDSLCWQLPSSVSGLEI